MKCQLMANLLYSGISLEDFLSNIDKAREHVNQCEDCKRDKNIESCLMEKIPDLGSIF